ncbi:hypothetical protein NM208_g6651 [Fusarium decemcellulare]|uniref:Uncharacterized protein n=1 Tax=Fusarium decemcellulare TaxID=57161 RepID=A0ACC1SCL4_9HYPO|nr:hypothetical protein NM208_g6651 [Fusarium decemcellulare]
MESDETDQAQLSHARQLIEELGEESGLIEQEYWDGCDDKTRKKFSNVISGLVSKLEPAVVALAQSLYSSNARFVYELLQNAEDNHFRRAKKESQLPYISFRMLDDRLVVDCNEDGFTEANLRAICSIGQSSKPAAEGYIGEKGIGFKSVFMAAWKVHIQSGVYSFYFKHRKSDSGMGMVQPRWKDPVEKLPPNQTRMTLYLHEDDDPGYTAAQRDSIHQQLRELNGDVLLFMRKLREICITTGRGRNEVSTVFLKGKEKENRIAISKTVTQGGRSETSTTVYHITKHRARNLAKNENRKYTREEERTKAYSSADVVLAFPLSPESVPIIEPQKVFAFLPVQSAGFSFLIQSDFMTNASREGIVVTAARNTGLLDSIADAFIEAALQFCDHPTLQYTWVRFLPDKPKNTYEAFWFRLATRIKEKVRTTPLIRPDSEGALRLITELCQPRPEYADKNNNLVLRDLEPEISLSRHYGHHEVNILRDFGLRAFTGSDVIKMVKRDLRAKTSWIRSRPSDNYLQSRVASSLADSYKNKIYSSVRADIEALPLLPLQDGRWLAADHEDRVFFPDTKGLTIPSDLDLNLIDTSAAAHTLRRNLFELLGVESLGTQSVRLRIFRRHRVYQDGDRQARLPTYVDQLKFLYSTHRLGVHRRSRYSDVLVIDRESYRRQPATEDVYLPDDNPLGPRELLKSEDSSDDSSDESSGDDPGFEVDFLHGLYLRDVPDKPQEYSPTWRDWLVEYVGLRRLLRLADMTSDPPDLSGACYYIADYKPEKFVAFLVHHWDQEGGPIAESLRLQRKLREIEVLCQGDVMVPLQDTYLPLTHLQSLAARFMAEDTEFPFLQLEEPLEQNHVSKEWDPLVSNLGIGYKEDLKFYLKILTELGTVDATDITDYHRIFELYSVIHGQYLQSVTKSMDLETIRSWFDNDQLVYIPASATEKSTWAHGVNCLWKAPSRFESMYPLQARLSKIFQEMPGDLPSLSGFFKDVLNIQDCRAVDIVDELEYLNGDSTQIDVVYELYRQLSSMTRDMPVSDQGDIKSSFTKTNLIYTGDDGGFNGWHHISECLWSSETEIYGLTTLEPHYEALYDFFVNFLGVKTLDLGLIYDELVRLGSSSEATREEIERHIWILNSFIPAAAQLPDARKLLGSKILPVRYPDGEVKLESPGIEFIVVDRASLGDIFKPLVKTLDFNLEQVRKLEPTLKWLGLETRYLSDVFWEDSRVESPSKQPLSSPRRRISPKAHALYRIAYHYDSPRLGGGSLYQTLKNAQVYETDGIASTLHIRQDGRIYSHDKSRSDLHIEYRNEQLDIFVPRDKKDQESCYARKLPLRLFEWLMTDPDTGIKTVNQKGQRVTASILDRSWFVIDGILEDEGIALGDVENDYFEGDQDPEPEGTHDVERGHSSEERTVPETRSSSDERYANASTLAETDTEEETPGLSTPTSSRFASPTRQGPSYRRSPARSTTNRQRTSFLRFSAPSPGSNSSSDVVQDVSYAQARTGFIVMGRRGLTRAASPLPSTIDSETARYRALLERVITAARTRSGLPSQGPFNMASMSEALFDLAGYNGYDGLDESSQFRSSSQFERDKKIGAAGELYVFELLKNLRPGLPGFSQGNWQSSIRRYVSAHPEYTDIGHWGHKETSDLIYDDVEGVLTELLIDNGYLERNFWEHKRPSYHLEVKTTTGPLGVPFYMSKKQYRLMHACRNDTDKIYVVFRVFEVDNAIVNLRLYVNPAAQEESNHLVFTEGTCCKTSSISSSLSYSTFFEDLAAWPSWDETASADWPDAEPVAAPSITFLAPAKQEAKTNTPWKDLQVTVDAKVKVAAEATREHFLSHFYQHLPNSEIDWSMNGLYVCRVVGLSYYGNSFAKPVKLKLPLKTKADLEHDAGLTAQFTAPTPSHPQPPTLELLAQSPMLEIAPDAALGSSGEHRR